MTPSEIDTRLLAAIRAEVNDPLVAQDTLRAVKDVLTDLGLMIAPGWRPIESAPKDGTEILILVHGMAIQARYEPGRWSDDTPISLAEYDGAVWCGFDDQVNFEIEETDHGDFHGPVTHWMPLLTPPAALSAEPFETGEVA